MPPSSPTPVVRPASAGDVTEALVDLSRAESALAESVPAQWSGPVAVPSRRGRWGLGLAELLEARPAASERSTAEVVDHIDGWARVIAYAQARQAGEVAELFARREAERKAACSDPDPRRRATAPDPVRVTTSEVALVLRASPRAAELVLDDAITLATFPSTALALRRGQIDQATARAIGAEMSITAPEHRAMLEAAALANAMEGATARQVKLFVRRTAMQLDPSAAATRATAARADRGMSKTEVVDDMGEMRVVMSAVELKAVWEEITTAAQALPATDETGNHVSLDDRRVTALVEMVTHPGTTRPCTHSGSGRWKTDVVVAASTLAGTDDDPALLAGYGLVTAEVARTIAADSDWRRTSVDPDDQVLSRSARRHRPSADAAVADPEAVLARRVDDVAAETITLQQAITSQQARRSTDAYRPTVSLRDHVEALHRRCRVPGCRRPATVCDLDHVTAHRVGGVTAACNLIPLCRFHHVLKHTDGWSIALAPDRTVTWTTPTNRRYRDPHPPSGTKKTGTGPTRRTRRESRSPHHLVTSRVAPRASGLVSRRLDPVVLGLPGLAEAERRVQVRGRPVVRGCSSGSLPSSRDRARSVRGER